MNGRELIKTVMSGGRGDRLPKALFGGGLWSYRQTGVTIQEVASSPERCAERLANFWGGLDTDIVFLGSGLNTFAAEAIGGSLSYNEGSAPLLSSPLIQKTEDARYLDTIDLAAAPHALGLIEMVSRVRTLLPDRFLYVTSWGPFTWAMILCDWNLLREKTETDPVFVKELCALGLRLAQSIFSPLIERGAIDGIAAPDGAVTLIPQQLYKEVVIPAERELFSWSHGRGIYGLLHQCGDIRSQYELYPETGADCISLDACVSIGEAYALYRNANVVTAGNVDVINRIYGADPADVCRSVVECARGIADPLSGYILMPSCDLPADTPLSRAKEFLSCADLM